MTHPFSPDRCRCVLVVLLILFSASALQAQEPSAPNAEDPAHEQLRALRDEALDAFEKKDIDRLLGFLHVDVVVTLQNAEVCKGHQEVRAFHERMSEGDDRSVQSQETVFEVDDLSVLHGEDTAIAYGSIHDDFQLSSGMEFQLESRWSATMVKEGDRWLLASFHASANMFENGVSDLMLKWNTIKTSGIALLVGVVAVAVVWKRRSRPA